MKLTRHENMAEAKGAKLVPGVTICLDGNEKSTILLSELFEGFDCISSLTIRVTGSGTLRLAWFWADCPPLDETVFNISADDGVITYGGGLANWDVAGEDVLRLKNITPEEACLVLTFTECEET